MIAVPSKLGLGVYSIPDAAKITGTTTSRLRRWLSAEDGLVQSRFSDGESVSFLELVELMFIKMFRDENVSLQTIRFAAKKASEKFDTDYPFAVKRFDTDGRTIFATLARSENKDSEMIEDLRHGQYVFRQVIKPFFKKLEYGGSHDAMKYWPLTKRGRVVLDPRRNLGQPIDAATGVPTRVLYDAFVSAGENTTDAASWFEVPVSAVEKAVAFERGS